MERGGRALTTGEVALLRAVYGDGIDYPRVRIHARRWFWPLSATRPMAPNGSIYFPGASYHADFSADTVPLGHQAVFVHEGAHLFQWYALGWLVWLRGPFDRRYRYALVPGRAFTQYGLEQMGMIAEHYFVLGRGRQAGGCSYCLADYAGLLPLS